MWMLASAQSTSLPFIQILPVPGNAAPDMFGYSRWKRNTTIPGVIGPIKLGSRSLFFVAERAAIRSRVQRFSAVPAEPCGRGFTRPQPALDALCVVPARASGRDRPWYRAGRRRPGRIPRREDVLEQLGRAL